MADFFLPIDSSDAAYTVDIPLSGTIYRFAVAWNTRSQNWSFSIGLPDQDPIVAGLRIVGDWQYSQFFTDARLPPGRLYSVDLSGTGLDPGREDLGDRVVMVYNDGE